MLLHQFTTTVQAPPIGAMWLLLAINSLAHEEFQFGFEIEKMMGTTVMVLLHIFTMEASGNHLISFPEILIGLGNAGSPFSLLKLTCSD